MPRPKFAKKSSVRAKLLRTMMGTLAGVGACILAIVAWLDIESTRAELQHTEGLIRENLAIKGRMLVESHAFAMRQLVTDNAFSGVQNLVASAVKNDPDVVYGLFLADDGRPWAYISPTHPEGKRPGPVDHLELGPHLGELQPNTIRRRERTLFSDSIQEHSLAVMDTGEFLGSVHYGISNRRMHAALAAAEIHATRSLFRALAITAGVVALSSFMGVLLTHRQSRRITGPLDEMAETASAIAGGDHERRVRAVGGDELEIVAHSFNDMVDELRRSHRSLTELNDSLEDKVNARTQELAGRNEDMRLVLDHVRQGLMTIDASGAMAREHSAIVERWLGDYEAGLCFWHYVSGLDPDFADSFEFGIVQLQQDVLPRDVCIDQLPTHMHVGSSQLEVSYVPLTESGPFAGLLIVIADISDQLARRAAEASQAEVMACIQRLATDPRAFATFFGEAATLVSTVIEGRDRATDTDITQALHSLKGTASLMGLEVVAEICHSIEDSLAQAESAEASTRITDLASRWRALDQLVAPFIVSHGVDKVTLSRRQLLELGERLDDAGLANLRDSVREWTLEPIEVGFTGLAEHARQLALRLERGPVTTTIEGGELQIAPDVWSGFFNELGHVIRNAIDHGMRPDTKGHLRLSASCDERRFWIDLEDDGRGIDWESVHKRAVELALPAEKHDDLVRALFHPGMSTRNQVSQTSGRGVGLAAVKQACNALDGTIQVTSRPDEGTHYRFEFPRACMTGRPHAASESDVRRSA